MAEMTIRVEGDKVVVSDDNGATTEVVDADLRQRLLEWVKDATRLQRSFEMPSAAARAVMAEARLMRPRTTGIGAHPETPPPTGHHIPLGPLVRAGPLDETFRRRRSERNVGALSLADLASVLVTVGRVRGWDEAPDGYQRTYRPVPSGGGRHPIELWVAAAEVAGLPSGVWKFESTGAKLLEHGPVPESLWAGAADALEGRQSLAALILLVAQFERTLSRYPAGAAMVWRDAGVVAMALHLQATAAGLRSTILATAGLLPLGPGLRCDVCSVLVGR